MRVTSDNLVVSDVGELLSLMQNPDERHGGRPSILGNHRLSRVWRVGFRPDRFPQGVLQEALLFGDEPQDMKPAVALITLRHVPDQGNEREFDHLWVVVNSPDTEMRFNDWYVQNADMSWTSGLPQPFSSISIDPGTAEPVDPEPGPPGQWGTPHRIASFLHHDARFEMRSSPVAGGYGHQATYDANGVLIEDPIAAGTADIAAPYHADGVLRVIGALKHREQDVLPFIRALQLDGNPVHSTDINRSLTRPCLYRGSHTDKYIDRRPVLPTGKQ